MLHLLLQTTIEGEPDGWNIARFSLLTSFLSELKDASGLPACVNVLIDPEKPYSRSTNVAV